MHIFSEQAAQMSEKNEREQTQKKKSARQLWPETIVSTLSSCAELPCTPFFELLFPLTFGILLSCPLTKMSAYFSHKKITHICSL